MKFRSAKESFQSQVTKKPQQNGPILIDFGEVYSNAVKECVKWLDMMGKSLSDTAR